MVLAPHTTPALGIRRALGRTGLEDDRGLRIRGGDLKDLPIDPRQPFWKHASRMNVSVKPLPPHPRSSDSVRVRLELHNGCHNFATGISAACANLWRWVAHQR